MTLAIFLKQLFGSIYLSEDWGREDKYLSHIYWGLNKSLTYHKG
jgi:hypothetical protein